MNLCGYMLKYLGGEIEGSKVLSLGCGIGITEVDFAPDQITGVDIYDYSDKFKGKFIQHDIRNIMEIMEEKSFDVVFCVDIIEHLEKEEGLQLIKDANALARKLVIFYTPIKWSENEQETDSWGYGNPALDHKSLWTPEDFYEQEYFSILPFPAVDSEGYMAVKRFE